MFAAFLQQLRNVIISSSVSIGLLSFNKTDKSGGVIKRGMMSRYIVRIIALFIILYSIFYGFNSIKTFKKNMMSISAMSNNNNQIAKDKMVFLHRWKTEIFFFYIYLFILIIIVIAIYIIPLLRNLF